MLRSIFDLTKLSGTQKLYRRRPLKMRQEQHQEDRFRRLARISPRAAIVEMRSELEQAMLDFASRHHLNETTSGLSPKRMNSILTLTRLFRARDLISPEVSALLDDVRAIGNSAVHSRGEDFTFEDAERFRKLWELVIAQFRSY